MNLYERLLEQVPAKSIAMGTTKERQRLAQGAMKSLSKNSADLESAAKMFDKRLYGKMPANDQDRIVAEIMKAKEATDKAINAIQRLAAR